MHLYITVEIIVEMFYLVICANNADDVAGEYPFLFRGEGQALLATLYAGYADSIV